MNFELVPRDRPQLSREPLCHRNRRGIAMSPTANAYAVQRDRVAHYFYWQHIVFIILIGIWFFGLGLVVAIVYAFTVGVWLPQKQAQALQYWLDGATVRVHLAMMPLPSASSCHPFMDWFSYRGLAPHQFMPMLGVHLRLHGTD